MKDPASDCEHFSMYIGGDLRPEGSGGATSEVENPANESVVYTVPEATKQDAEAALQAAQVAQRSWAKLPAVQRGAHLIALAEKIRENREHLARILTHEQGKTYQLALGEVDVSADFLNFPAQGARRLEGDIFPSDNPDEHLYIHKVPYGVCAGIVAWNFPLALACRKLGPALTAGNTMVIKPPEITPVAVLELGRLANEAGLPPGVLNVVTGAGSVVGRELVTNKITRLVTMTGSTQTGQRIFADCAPNLTAIRLELGGKAPFILLEDGDVEKAVEAAMLSRYLNQGQVCTCSERFYIHDAVHDEFVEKFVAASSKLKMGDPMDSDTDIGPKVSRFELEQMEQRVSRALEQGCTLALGGRRPTGAQFEKGHWYEPTILTDANNEMEIMREEVFGVVSPIMRVNSFEQAIELANDSDYGLSAYLFTNNSRNVQRIVGELDFGEIYVNRGMGEQRQGFHNGYKLSGTGGEDGKYGMENYLEKKTVYLNYSE